MMGQFIRDPQQIESAAGEIAGLAILPVETVLLNGKTTRQCHFTYRDFSEICIGYEIHMGETMVHGINKPVAFLDGKQTDGYFLSEKCWGSYLHGILDNQVVINDLVAPYTDLQVEYVDYLEFRSEQYDKLAVLLRENLDIDQVYQQIKDYQMFQGHGDDGYLHRQKIAADFSTNVWYGGAPSGLKEHLFAQWENVQRYPEVLAESLTEKIAISYGFKTENILVTNGSTESIYLVAQAYQNKKKNNHYPSLCRIRRCL
ncbi:hypothetical protein [Pedobacter sp. NJ-S-72]